MIDEIVVTPLLSQITPSTPISFTFALSPSVPEGGYCFSLLIYVFLGKGSSPLPRTSSGSLMISFPTIPPHPKSIVSIWLKVSVSTPATSLLKPLIQWFAWSPASFLLPYLLLIIFRLFAEFPTHTATSPRADDPYLYHSYFVEPQVATTVPQVHLFLRPVRILTLLLFLMSRISGRCSGNESTTPQPVPVLLARITVTYAIPSTIDSQPLRCTRAWSQTSKFVIRVHAGIAKME